MFILRDLLRQLQAHFSDTDLGREHSMNTGNSSFFDKHRDRNIKPFEGLAKPVKASGISGQNGQKKKITCPV